MNSIIDDIKAETERKVASARTAASSEELASVAGLGTNLSAVWTVMDRARELYSGGNPEGQKYLAEAVNSPYRSVFEEGCRTLEGLGYNNRAIAGFYKGDFKQLNSAHFVRLYFETGKFLAKE